MEVTDDPVERAAHRRRASDILQAMAASVADTGSEERFRAQPAVAAILDPT